MAFAIRCFRFAAAADADSYGCHYAAAAIAALLFADAATPPLRHDGLLLRAITIIRISPLISMMPLPRFDAFH